MTNAFIDQPPTPLRLSAVPVKVRSIREDARIPKQAHAGDAGFDLHAAGDEIVLQPGDRAKVPTGLAFEIPVGYEIQVRPRSGLAIKSGITCLNSPGTIDSGYRGEVCVILYNASREPFTVRSGDRVAQAVLARVESILWVESDELESSSRGEGGFGSTGVGGKG
ncbi:MAG: dUTP diphosphatase [Candidatus Hydrogenedentota bacterium]